MAFEKQWFVFNVFFLKTITDVHYRIDFDIIIYFNINNVVQEPNKIFNIKQSQFVLTSLIYLTTELDR